MTTNPVLNKLILDQSKCDRMNVQFPSYNRDQLKHGIVHLSVGNFHRSHLAYYMDILASDYKQTEWGIVGIGVRSVDRPMSAVLKAQHGLYTLVSKGRDENDVHVRVIGSLIDYVFAPDEPLEAMAVLVHPNTKIVSMTITVAGYDFDVNQADIQHDLTNADRPKTIFGLLVHALDARRQGNEKPFTVLSCDNVQHNGDVTRKHLLKFARELHKPELIDYIQTKVTFPNAMGKNVEARRDMRENFFDLVDRITPVTTDTDREYVRSNCGLADGWPVIAEHYIQWVVEDSFCNGRPPLELLSSSSYNVLMTNDVEPYEFMKMRLLNASHTAMSSLGYLMGYIYIHEIITDEHVKIYIQQLMDREITPILPEVPGIDFDQYKQTLIERFANPTIKDKAVRICMDGASKFPKFIVPTILEQFKRGKNPHYFALTIAAWIRYLAGIDEHNQVIVLQDSLAMEHQLDRLAKGKQSSVREILSIKPIFDVVAENEEFIKKVERVVGLLYEIGAKETLKQWISEASTNDSDKYREFLL